MTNLLKLPSECDSQPTPHLTYFCLSPDMCGIWDIVIQVFDSSRRSNIKVNSGMWRGDVLSNPHFLKNIKKLKCSFKAGLNQILLNPIKSGGWGKCCGQSYKAVFYELWFLMILALSVHIQLELLSCSQTWVKSKLKSFQILLSVCLSLSRTPAGWDLYSFLNYSTASAVPDKLNWSIAEKYFS